MFNLCFIVGTRPELIRSSGLLKAIAAGADFNLTVVFTGQHYDHAMIGRFLLEFDVDFDVVFLEDSGYGGLSSFGRLFAKLDSFFSGNHFDLVCVFGDTDSTVAAAWTAKKNGLRISHLESGCRSYDISMSEEINRRSIDHMADLLFCFSDHAKTILLGEGVLGYVELISDPQYDVFTEASLRKESVDFISPKLDGILTLHRQENTRDRLQYLEILSRIDISLAKHELKLLYPVHPRTTDWIDSEFFPSLVIVDPIGYSELIGVLSNSLICVTDSGGLQKDAFWSGVPCVTLRKSTEWVETVDLGFNFLCDHLGGLDQSIRSAVELGRFSSDVNPYIRGSSVEEFVSKSLTFLG